MQRRRSVFSIVFVLVASVFLGLSGTGRVSAAADATDEQSIGIGAQLYELYCTECHGVDTNDHNISDHNIDVYDTGEIDVSKDYSELIEIVRRTNERKPELVQVEDWPEWSDNPAPYELKKEDLRAEAIEAVAQAIDKVQPTELDPDTHGNWGDEAEASGVQRFDPVPGATNLADPHSYSYGTSEQDLFNSIANGTGAAMPAWRTELGSDEAIWDVVNYIRSLWGEEWLY
jgi:mono/diheme cytochrome c family protein